MKKSDVIVIGAGPGGIEAAVAAARAGASVILITDGPVGGRANWHSLVPSKVWLGAVEGHGRAATPERVLSRLQETKQEWSSRQEQSLHRAGVSLWKGAATFAGENEVAVMADGQEKTVAANSIIVATGSVPVFPDGLKPDGRQVIAPRLMSGLDSLPRSVAVIGAGATGCEAAHLFSALGLAVSWIIDEFGVLPGYHPDGGQFLADSLQERGVNIYHGQAASAIDRSGEDVVIHLAGGETVAAEMAFVAVGRKPDLGNLHLENAGLDPAQLAIDGYGRTANPHVYLIGDASGAPLVANKAMAQGRIAGRHAAGNDVAPYEPRLLLLATYSEPEIAQIGDVTSPGLIHARVGYDEALKPWLLPRQEGFVDLAFDASTQRLVGGLAAGYHAADVLAPLISALRSGATVEDLAGLYGAHPTLGELAFAAARQLER